MHIHHPNPGGAAAALPARTCLQARTNLRVGQWRCYPQDQQKKHRQFACVNTADFELLIGEIDLAYGDTRADLWSSVDGPTADYDRASFYETLLQWIPDTPENAAALQVLRGLYWLCWNSRDKAIYGGRYPNRR